jgi:hypothetical protein
VQTLPAGDLDNLSGEDMNLTTGQKVSRTLFLAALIAVLLLDLLVWRPG